MLKFYIWCHLRKARAVKVDMHRMNDIVKTLFALSCIQWWLYHGSWDASGGLLSFLGDRE